MARHAITLLYGEGEQDLVAAVRRILQAARVEIDWQEPDVPPYSARGWNEGEWEAVTAAIRSAEVALCGALGAARPGLEWSPHIALRRRCRCFAGLRPIKRMRGLPARVEALDLVVVRETTEDVYAGHEHEVMPGGVATLKVVTEAACERIADFAFSYAVQHGRGRISIIHKANIMKLTDGMFLRTARRVAERYPDIACDDLIVDNASMQMVLRPERFDVVLCGNLYGDILSALAAGLVGAVAAQPGVAIGDDAVIFESLRHPDSDPRLRGVINPLPLLLPAFHMLQFLGEQEPARAIWEAAEATLCDGSVLTADLGGTASLDQMADAIAERL